MLHKEGYENLVCMYTVIKKKENKKLVNEFSCGNLELKIIDCR